MLGLFIDSHIFRWEWKTNINFGLAIIKFSVGMEDNAELIKWSKGTLILPKTFCAKGIMLYHAMLLGVVVFVVS